MPLDATDADLQPRVGRHLPQARLEAVDTVEFRRQQHAKDAARYSGVCWSGMGPGRWIEPTPEQIEAHAVEIATRRAKCEIEHGGAELTWAMPGQVVTRKPVAVEPIPDPYAGTPRRRLTTAVRELRALGFEIEPALVVFLREPTVAETPAIIEALNAINHAAAREAVEALADLMAGAAAIRAEAA
jgi:hypothetical protein